LNLVSLAQLQELPPKNLILLVGPPGSGKSTFCEQTILQNLAIDKPVIYVTTEYDPSKAEASLREKGLARIEPDLLSFVDAYSETVGLSVSDRPDTVHADCANLSSVGIAITKLQERIGKKDILLVFDSLTSPYVLSGPEVVRFIRLTLSRFAGEGNSVLTCFDEGSGKEEDLVAMMSFSSGVIKIETEDGRRVLNVVKHPKVEATRIEGSRTKVLEKLWDMRMWEEKIMEFPLQAMKGEALATVRGELGNYVNLFWPNFAHWSEILWDPKGFPEMAYEMSKKHGEGMKEMMEVAPWHQRMLFRMLMPKSFSKVKDMKKLGYSKMMNKGGMGMGILEYVEDASKTDEHYFRVYESADCWGFENVGAAMASILPPSSAGACKGIESWKGLERDWNAVETKCIGLGDPYCEIKVVPGEIDELKASLEAIDITVLERMHDRLMNRLMGFMLHGKPLWTRPKLGSTLPLAENEMNLLPMASERYRMALRMGGAKVGREVSEHLNDAGIGGDDAVKHAINLLEHCKVGKVTLGETIRIRNSFESLMVKFMTTKREEPCCYFTTGFLNGFFSTVKNQHVKETKCIGLGDSYCEWEFR
jgi:predicted hydrocarbon binding protein/KaiC/GvpD/RAD55 family RecA-like ATPase